MSERRSRPSSRDDRSSSSRSPRSGGSRTGGSGGSRSSGSGSGGPRSGGPRSSGAGSGGPRSSDARSGGARSGSSRSEGRSFRDREVVNEGEGRARRPRPGSERSTRDDDRPRGPRRDDDRPRGSRRDDDRPRGPRRDDDRPRGPRRDDDRPRGPRRDDDRRPRRYSDDDKPQTAARRRSQEVRERTGGRRTDLSMSTPPQRSREEWIDEGSVRDRGPKRGPSAGASRSGVSQHVIRKTGGARARTSTRPARGGRREVRAMDAVVEEIERAVGARASGRVLRRYEAALASFEAHRYSEARIVLVPLAREGSDVAAIRELLGLCYYRESNWKKAIEHLEAALQLNPGWIFNHAVLADCHRALGNYKRVEELWEEIGEASPHPELLAEARIVLAMSIVDQGDLTKALSIMVKTLTTPKRVQEYHLRQWYVLADIHDRLGNVIKAREVFQRIADIDANFADVAERMSDLGA